MKGGYGVGKGGKASSMSSYNCDKNTNTDKGYAKPKPIGAKVHKPSPDMATPATGKGNANGGGKAK